MPCGQLRIFKDLGSALGVKYGGAREQAWGEACCCVCSLDLTVGPKPSGTHCPRGAPDLPADQTAPEANAVEQSNKNFRFSVGKAPDCTARP